MNIINPSQSVIKTSGGLLRHLQSIYKAMNGALAEAQPIGQDSAGVYNKFQQDNSNGVMIRIGATDSNEAIKWNQGSAFTAVNHGLQRQPIGFKVYDKDKPCDVFRTNTPTSDIINLTCTDPTANTTIYIF